MFICSKCNSISLPGEKMEKVITLQRSRDYWNVIYQNFTKEKRYLQFDKKDIQILKDLEKDGYEIVREYWTRGSEIKKELKICNKCK